MPSKITLLYIMPAPHAGMPLFTTWYALIPSIILCVTGGIRPYAPRHRPKRCESLPAVTADYINTAVFGSTTHPFIKFALVPVGAESVPRCSSVPPRCEGAHFGAGLKPPCQIMASGDRVNALSSSSSSSSSLYCIYYMNLIDQEQVPQVDEVDVKTNKLR
jgi:hypothetical protein